MTKQDLLKLLEDDLISFKDKNILFDDYISEVIYETKEEIKKLYDNRQ